MRNFDGAILVTGATGLVGGELLRKLFSRHPHLCAFVLVRDRRRWDDVARRLRLPLHRIMPVVGDVTAPAVGLSPADRARLTRCLVAVVHAAADTTFSRELPQARAVNRDGTRQVVELAAECRVLERFAYVSTAFVAGRRTGAVLETGAPAREGWVNAYEQSKHEAEAIVRSSGLPWAIVRPSTIVCADESGRVTQINAVHRSLRLLHAGLASLLPGEESTPVDVVTNDYVADAIARILVEPASSGSTYHLCAGAGALPLGELIDRSFGVWSRDERWRRRALPRPALTDLATYLLFESTVEAAGDARLQRVVQSMSHFVPQLALPKRFDTAAADAVVGRPAPVVAGYWARMLEQLSGVQQPNRRGRAPAAPTVGRDVGTFAARAYDIAGAHLRRPA